jgi:hypothetical protein
MKVAKLICGKFQVNNRTSYLYENRIAKIFKISDMILADVSSRFFYLFPLVLEAGIC